MQHESASASLFHLLSRYAYLQDLLEHQRVLVLGNAEAASAEALARQGVKRAVFIDGSDKRVQEAKRECSSRRVEFMVGPFARVALVEDSFDVAIIEDFGCLESRERDLSSAKRGLTSSGVLVACIPNPDASVGLTRVSSSGLGYYEFYGQLADSFPFVRMIGQCPLVGFALADLAVDDPDASITFDSSMLEEGSEDAEFFVALCSRSPITADPFAVVQVPLSWVDGRRLMGVDPTQQERRRSRGSRDSRSRSQGEVGRDSRSRSQGEVGRDSRSRSQGDVTEEDSRAKAPVDTAAIERLERELKRKDEESTKEISKVKLELDKKAVTIAKLENHLREAREKAALEHDRVIQAKIALEAEKKKLLNLQKDVEMGRRIQQMSPGVDEAKESDRRRRREDISEIKGRIQSLEKELESAKQENGKLLREVQSLEEQLEKAGADVGEVEKVKAQLEAEKKSRKEAESKAADLQRRGSRADGLAADLAKERGARKLAESHASELEKKLRTYKKSQSVKSKVSPAQAALKKAEAAFGGRVTPEQVEALRQELTNEQKARAALEVRLEELGREDAALDLQEQLAKEREARKVADDAKSDLMGKLSKSEALTAKLKALGEARSRAESAFGSSPSPMMAFEPTEQIPAKTMIELTTCLEEKEALQSELDKKSSRCRGLEQKVDALEVDLEKKQQRCQDLDKKVESLSGAAVSREKEHQKFEALRRRCEELESELSQLQASIQEGPSDEGDEQLESYREQLRREERQRREIEADLASIEAEHGREITRLERALTGRSREVMELNEKLERQSDVLGQVLEDMRELGSQSPELEAGVERREAELLELRSRLEASERQSASLRLEVSQRDQKLTDLAGEIQGHQWRISELELSADQPSVESEEGAEVLDVPVLSLGSRRVAESRDEEVSAPVRGDEDREFARAQGQVDALERERQQHLQEIQSLRESFSEAQRKMVTLEVEARASHAQATSAFDSLKVADQRCREFDSRVEQANTRASAMERKAAETVGQLHVVERELEACHSGQQKMKSELGELRQELGSTTAQRFELETRSRRLEKDLALTRKEAADSSRDLAAAQACVALLEEQIPGVSDLLGEIRQDETAEFPALSLCHGVPRELGRDQAESSGFGLPSDVKALRDQLTAARVELDRAKTRETVLQARIDEYIEALGRHDEETAKLSRQIAELEQELSSASDRSARLMGELAKAQAAASIAREELTELAEQTDSAVLESAGSSAQMEQLQDSLSQARAAAVQERRASAQSLEELEKARAELEELRVEIHQAKENAEQVSVQGEPAQDEVELAGLKRLLDSCRQSCAHHEGEAVGLGFKVRELESALSDALSSLKVLRGEAERAQHRSSTSEASTARIEELEREAANLRKKEAALSARVEQVSQELTAARRRAAELEYVDQHVKEWASRLEEAERHGDRLRSELDEAHQALRSAQSSGEEEQGLKTQVEQLNEQLQTLSQERRDAEDALERVIDGFSDVSGDAAALIDVLEDREDLIERLEQNIAMRKKAAEEQGSKPKTTAEPSGSLEECNEQLQAARRVVESLEADKRRLGAMIDELKKAQA